MKKKKSPKLQIDREILVAVLGGEVDADGTHNPKPETVIYSTWPGC